jgi:FkbM family methyltransferase
MVKLSLGEVVGMLVGVREHTAKPSQDEQVAFLRYCVQELLKSRAQILQDLWVAYEMQSRRNGFFVEFGGADGVKFSNTYYLEAELGWRGIVAEPARVWHPAVRQNRACFVDDRCVWIRSGEKVIFNQPAIAVHSTIEAYSDSDKLAHTRKEGLRYEVETISLNDLLAYWSAPRRIDYLSIDTEGSELDILQAFDFGAYDVRLITVEHNHSDKRQPLYDFLTSKGYRRKFERLSGVDDWYVKTY